MPGSREVAENPAVWESDLEEEVSEVYSRGTSQ